MTIRDRCRCRRPSQYGRCSEDRWVTRAMPLAFIWRASSSLWLHSCLSIIAAAVQQRLAAFLAMVGFIAEAVLPASAAPASRPCSNGSTSDHRAIGARTEPPPQR
jgi:hypothetical protein